MSDDAAGKAEVSEREAVALIKLIVELDPVQPQGVQETLHGVHAQQNPERQAGQEDEADEHLHRQRGTMGMPMKPAVSEF